MEPGCESVCVHDSRVWEIDLAADGSICGHCGTVASLGEAGTSGLTDRSRFYPAASTRLSDFIKFRAAAPSLKLHVILQQPQDEKYSGKTDSLEFKLNYVYAALLLHSKRHL